MHLCSQNRQRLNLELDQAQQLEQLLLAPERILQFGTGALLRGLVDYAVDQSNKRGHFFGRVVVVKSTSYGDVRLFREQESWYVHAIRGLVSGQWISENHLNVSISRVLDAHSDWSEVLQAVSAGQLSLIVSNTTEVGITFVEEKLTLEAPSSFPAKLLAVLYHRYCNCGERVAPGFVILPTELVVNNGNLLRDIVISLSHYNNHPESFRQWINASCTFCNTLVDRIVPGTPEQALQREINTWLGADDGLSIVSEPYMLWAIEVPNEAVSRELSFLAAIPGIVLASEIATYREIKLRLLNGCHSLLASIALLLGYETVDEAMKDSRLVQYLASTALHEVIPVLQSSGIAEGQARYFFDQMLDRFRNPFLHHTWRQIAVHGTKKMQLRVVPILLQYLKIHPGSPDGLLFGLAAHVHRIVYDHSPNKSAEDELTGTIRKLYVEHELEHFVPLMLQSVFACSFDPSQEEFLQDRLVYWLRQIDSLGIESALHALQSPSLMAESL